DRKAQHDAAERVSGLFDRMSLLAGKIMEVQQGAKTAAAKLPDGDALRGDLAQLADNADALRKKIVATKEGGAITGEERLREHMDFVYGAIMSVESRPTSYQLARVDALEHELRDVESDFAALSNGELATVNGRLKAKGMEEIALVEPVLEPAGGGGEARALASSLIGLHVFGTMIRPERAERD
ncbi:MAG: sialidase, partial [Rhizomicrobium sp.]